MTTAARVLQEARATLGTRETPVNRTPFARCAGHANGQPWCATWVVCCFRRAGLTLPAESAYTPTMMNALPKVKSPQPGDLGFLWFAPLGRVAHVWIVEAVRADGRMVTLEGNTNDGGSRDGNGVYRRVRSRSGVTLCRPAYSKIVNPDTLKPLEKSDMEYIDKTSGDGAVRLLQTCLRNEARKAGRSAESQNLVVDGDWGAATQRAFDVYTGGRVKGVIPGRAGGASLALLLRYEKRAETTLTW